jgi:hypothetical protein
MATKPPRRSRSPNASSKYATAEDIREIHRIFAERGEMLVKLQHTCTIQFRRIAQIQAELDELKKATAELPFRRS